MTWVLFFLVSLYSWLRLLSPSVTHFKKREKVDLPAIELIALSLADSLFLLIWRLPFPWMTLVFEQAGQTHSLAFLSSISLATFSVAILAVFLLVESCQKALLLNCCLRTWEDGYYFSKCTEYKTERAFPAMQKKSYFITRRGGVNLLLSNQSPGTGNKMPLWKVVSLNTTVFKIHTCPKAKQSISILISFIPWDEYMSNCYDQRKISFSKTSVLQRTFDTSIV